MPPVAEEPRLARLGPALAALATFALHAACWGRYGIFRDELYFLLCGERLSAGYVDQPPGIALVARLAGALFGTWVPGLRLLAWLAAALTVYLAGRLAARLRGGGAGAILAAAATASCLLLLGTSSFLSMNAFEPLLVLALVTVLLRLSRGEDPRLWIAAGGLAGLAVLMKYSSAVISLALLAGLVLTPARRSLRTPWALAGGIFGLLVVLPNFAWQASHGFPFLELVRNQLAYKNAPTSPLGFLRGLLFESNPLDAPVWLGGLGWLLWARPARDARFAGAGGLLYLLVLTFGHAKPYYAAPLLPVLLAAGGVALASLRPLRWLRWAWGGALVASALALAPLAVPILPLKALLAYLSVLGAEDGTGERNRPSVLPQVYADQLGWDELVAGVARAYASLSPGERARAAVFGENYGVASAVEILGPAHGLPRGLAVSGHNQFWLWGVPPGRGDPLIVVSDERETCGGLYREQQLFERLPSTPYVMPYEDRHALWICRGAREPLRALPPAVRHFE